MKRFLAIYTGSMDGFERAGWNTLDPEARKAREAEGMKAWTSLGSSWISTTGS